MCFALLDMIKLSCNSASASGQLDGPCYCVSSLNELMCMHVCAYNISIAFDCVSYCVVLCVVLLDPALTAATCEPRRSWKRGNHSRECF